MTQLLDDMRIASGGDDAATQSDAIVAQQIARTLRATFHQVLGASLAASPRPLRQTLEVALAYGISCETEAHYLWLAALALALPLPAGWVQLDHPTKGAPFWHNEICGSSQWQHPVDDFVKATIKMQRAPSSPHVQAMRRSRNPRKRRTAQLGVHPSPPAGMVPVPPRVAAVEEEDAEGASFSK